MSDLHSRPTGFAWPPFIFISAVALAIILTVMVPLPWLSGILAEFLFAVGCLMLAGGIALIGLSIRAMRRGGTTVNPTRGATQLVTSGPFGISRNPIYLGETIIMIAIALIAWSPWFLVMGFVAAVATNYLAVLPEEKHLDLRFGRRYRDYSKRVRRWI